MRVNFHGDELNPLGGAEMGAQVQAEAISHLEEVGSPLDGFFISYHFSFENDPQNRALIEKHVFGQISPEGIQAMATSR